MAQAAGVFFNGGSFYYGVPSPRGSQIPSPRRLSSIHGGTFGAFSSFLNLLHSQIVFDYLVSFHDAFRLRIHDVI